MLHKENTSVILVSKSPTQFFWPSKCVMTGPKAVYFALLSNTDCLWFVQSLHLKVASLFALLLGLFSLTQRVLTLSSWSNALKRYVAMTLEQFYSHDPKQFCCFDLKESCRYGNNRPGALRAKMDSWKRFSAAELAMVYRSLSTTNVRHLESL